MLTKTVILEFVASVLMSWNENLLLYESLISVIISLPFIHLSLFSENFPRRDLNNFILRFFLLFIPFFGDYRNPSREKEKNV